ncbi:hypothetical protein M409DRAFT_52981 [Zasmidium cellare ATCC 36951]|uniref:Uncharacterized protein n=1 Tax=Zasmidium cellare ATCC 36951 TaxID=1080233 RepID=A0A6A6CTB0_ZASCE|nr:uncharacterized protein M409DRAFT_52981 [Zasmidium cellare ATCC 36951]KAF2169009.1 hypothetical protein M409DRAFT_52981 [Zasmidium cellare ATCC 36951]
MSHQDEMDPTAPRARHLRRQEQPAMAHEVGERTITTPNGSRCHHQHELRASEVEANLDKNTHEHASRKCWCLFGHSALEQKVPSTFEPKWQQGIPAADRRHVKVGVARFPTPSCQSRPLAVPGTVGDIPRKVGELEKDSKCEDFGRVVGSLHPSAAAVMWMLVASHRHRELVTGKEKDMTMEDRRRGGLGKRPISFRVDRPLGGSAAGTILVKKRRRKV